MFSPGVTSTLILLWGLVIYSSADQTARFASISSTPIMLLILYVSITVFITLSNYIGCMFRLLSSHLQAYSLQGKSKDAVHTLGSQCVLHQ